MLSEILFPTPVQLPVIWVDNGDGPECTYNGETLVFSACRGDSGNASINLDVSTFSGCRSFSPVQASPGVTPSGDSPTTGGGSHVPAGPNSTGGAAAGPTNPGGGGSGGSNGINSPPLGSYM